MNSLRAHHPVAIYFAAADGDGSVAASDARIKLASLQELPPSVHLHTLRTSLGADLRCSPFPPRQCDAAAGTSTDREIELLIRLQHLFSAEDDPGGLSKPVAVDLREFLAPWGKVLQIDETTLTAAQVISADVSASLTLSPMEIRTFIASTASTTCAWPHPEPGLYRRRR